jgi:hypothetical protein
MLIGLRYWRSKSRASEVNGATIDFLDGLQASARPGVQTGARPIAANGVAGQKSGLVAVGKSTSFPA